MRNIFLVVIAFCIGNVPALGQFQTGMYTSNQAGVLGVTINPANTNYLNNGTDILLFNYSTAILNNGFYLEKKPITKILSPKTINAFTDKSGTDGESINQTFDRIFNLKRSLKDKNYIFADVAFHGPSFLINYKKHSFGLLTSFKSNSGTVNMPPEMATFILKGAAASELQSKTFSLNKVASVTNVSRDIAFNYSYQIAETYTGIHRLGITAHYIKGINSLVFQDLGNTKWTFIGDSTIYMEDGNILYNYAATKSAKVSDLLDKRGTGFSFDIGYTYVKKKKSRPTRITNCPNIRFLGKVRQFQEYKWKMGVALMDIGVINYTTQTVTTQYNDAYGPTKNLDQEFYLGVFALDRKLRADFSGNPGVTFKAGKSFSQYTATRLNVQFDYYFRDNIFFGFAASQRLPIPGGISMYAPNILSLNPRYEKLKYEIGLPISLIEYQYPVIGLNFRVGPFYMGTNHLPEMIGLRNIKGVDIYMGLKINLSNFRGV
jgi:hypothetical protein